MIGKRFGRWEVVSFAGVNHDRHLQYFCRCDCGNEKIIPGARLRSGKSKSCGCLRNEYFSEKHKTHGKSRSRSKCVPNSREYRAWCDMKTRCRRHRNYKDISVYEKWADNFEAFYLDMGQCPEGKTLDRINPYGNYDPENCRWATHTEQANNRKAAFKAAKALGRPLKEDECLLFANGKNRSDDFAIIHKSDLSFFQKHREKIRSAK